MNQPLWTAVDQYFTEFLSPNDSALEAALHDSEKAQLHPHNVTAPQGKLLYILARLISAKNILEIGTLGGYSTIWLARALPSDGYLTTIEFEQDHADIAGRNIERAGLSHLVHIRVGQALATLPLIKAENREPFDLVFIDADKTNNDSYLDWALQLTRKGSIIVGDNVVRGGAVLEANSASPGVHGIRRFIERLSTDERVEATAIQTVGSKGYDGFAIAVVK